MKLAVTALAIPDVKLISAPRFSDARGHFAETYARADFVAAGLATDFVQDNQAASRTAGTVRGLHFQTPPHAQAKLVRVLRGRIFDVALDIRRGSPSFGRHVAVTLDSEAGQQLFVPVGFAHGYCTLEPDTEVLYKVDSSYAPTHERGVLWSDPALGIAWPVDVAAASIADRDKTLPTLAALQDTFA
ncbi:MAG: dTDP-4-dehydrorhamnose 3,5-epimerase [Xanthobacteraceae bacterium]|jgi:dTDP-4-dehydrorhamnose 3,5-epimerase|uniref:dTDP-4-dehydrorhamnose 3,5-epimerase n=1 Tax=Pseudolabrys sp. TaxID=1960880 RepID=UPI003D0A81F0